MWVGACACVRVCVCVCVCCVVLCLCWVCVGVRLLARRPFRDGFCFLPFSSSVFRDPRACLPSLRPLRDGLFVPFVVFFSVCLPAPTPRFPHAVWLDVFFPFGCFFVIVLLPRALAYILGFCLGGMRRPKYAHTPLLFPSVPLFSPPFLPSSLPVLVPISFPGRAATP